MVPAPVFYLGDADSYDGDSESGSSDIDSHAHHRVGESNVQSGGRGHVTQESDMLNNQENSRSRSSLSFSPGPHRRSHPNLQHLSLAPLTPKYPINPSDYNAYVDPETSQLHTSSSLSHIASMPSPSGILSESHRPTTRPAHRKSKSSASIRHRPGTFRRGLSEEEAIKMVVDGASQWQSRPSSGPRRTDSSWLLQTGIALTEGSRESKGQSWLAKRASSTSLHSGSDEYPNYEYGQATAPKRTTPPRSRRASRERRKSRRDLLMTPTPVLTTSRQELGTAFASPDEVEPGVAPSTDPAPMQPDWADSQTQAEIAASLEREFSQELDDDGLGLVLDDDGNHHDYDLGNEEREIQAAVHARGFRLGRWMDGLVDVFLQIDDGEAEAAQEEECGLDDAPPASEEEPQEASDVAESPREGEILSEDDMEPAPQNPKSMWEDMAWFGRLVLRTAMS